MTERTKITPNNHAHHIYSGRPDTASGQIPVTTFIDRYRILNSEASEALYAFPTLSYLLGEVSEPQPLGDARPDGIMRPVRYLLDGSGMFGLEHPEDAMRWRGIFNHIMGTARQVAYLSEKLSTLSTGQKQEFARAGVDAASFDEINPDLLRDFMFISHAGRRQVYLS